MQSPLQPSFIAVTFSPTEEKGWEGDYNMQGTNAVFFLLPSIRATEKIDNQIVV